MTGWAGAIRGWILVAGIAVVWLAVDRPWTIVPIDRDEADPFDAAAYVTSIWDERARPAIEAHAVGVGFFHQAAVADPAVRAGAVAVDGVVVEVDTTSRVGVATIDLSPADGRPDATVQIGPVLRGTALRDALDFIQFSDFTNQIEFAAVGRALNDRVALDVLVAIDFGELTGRHVRIVGAASFDRSTADALPSIVPVRFTIEDAR